MIGITERVAEIFEEADCPYVVTGGVAVVYYGVLRLTHDTDFLTQGLSEPRVNKLLNLLDAKGFDFDEGEARRKLQRGGIVRMMGAKGFVKGFVVDLITRRGMKPVLEHAHIAEGDGKIHIISPEDLIVHKLSIIEESPPSKLRPQDKEDVAALLLTKEELNLDMDYLHKRAKDEGVNRRLGKFLEEIEKIAE